MNFLAHLYLSGENEKIITGNFIGDYVKGKNYLKYPEEISKGILLHRKIDTFTDQHFLFRETKKLFREEFGLYSGVVTDLIFDHILALNWDRYHPETLRKFAQKSHAVLLKNIFYIPPRVKTFLPFMIKDRRLESYADSEGIRESLEIMSRHTSLPAKADQAIEVLNKNFSTIELHFTNFMSEVIDYTETKCGITITKSQFFES